MSAMNVLIQSDRVHLMTDGASCWPDGRLAMIGPKVRAMPHLNCAVAIRGPYLVLAPFFEEISAAATSFDILKGRIVPLMKLATEHYRYLLDQCVSGPDFEIIVAGISESSGPSAYFLPSHAQYGAPWVLTDLTGFVPVPCDRWMLAEMQEITRGKSPAEIDPMIDGLAVMEAQREHRIFDNKLCPIGVFAQLTTVSAEGVSSRIVRRWPDEIGTKVSG